MIRSVIMAIVGVICLNMMIVPFQAAVIGNINLFIVMGICVLSVLAGILVYPKKFHYILVMILSTVGLTGILIPFMTAFNLLGTVQVTMLLIGVLFMSYTVALINDLK